MTILPASVARGATDLDRAAAPRERPAGADPGHQRRRWVEPAVPRREARRSSASTRTARVKAGSFLDMRSLVDDAVGERGLLGLAFHPDFETNRRLYVYYTRDRRRHRRRPAHGERVRHAGRRARPARACSSSSTARTPTTTAARWRSGRTATCTSGPATAAGPATPAGTRRARPRTCSARSCASTSTGAGPGPTGATASRRRTRSAGRPPACDEIWAYGLRNPWRISFDRATGSLFIADVGQSRYEEIDREPAGYHGGRNYGWNVMEGKHCYNASGCSTSGKTMPVAEYAHTRRELLDHRRLRLPRTDVSGPRRARTSSPTSAAAGSGRCPPTGPASGCAATRR